MIASLIAGVPTGRLASSLLIPIIGLGATILPIATASAGLAYAVGKVFVRDRKWQGRQYLTINLFVVVLSRVLFSVLADKSIK